MNLKRGSGGDGKTGMQTQHDGGKVMKTENGSSKKRSDEDRWIRFTSGLAHDFVTPNKPVTMRFVRPHGRDVDDVVACDETEREETTDEELGPS